MRGDGGSSRAGWRRSVSTRRTGTSDGASGGTDLVQALDFVNDVIARRAALFLEPVPGVLEAGGDVLHELPVGVSHDATLLAPG